MFKSEIDFRNSKPRCLVFPFGKAVSASWKRQRLASAYYSETQKQLAWNGFRISGNAPDSFITDE